MSNTSRPYYRPSDRVTMVAATGMLIACTPLAAAIGGGYGFVARHNPVAYANILLYVLFLIVIGAVTVIAVRVAKVRTPWLAGVVAGFAAIIGVYAAWVVWLHEFGFRTIDGAVIVWPGDLIETVRSIASGGAWRVRDFVPPAATLYAVWSAEALLVLGTCARLAHRRANQSFCEACGSWTKRVYDGVNLARPIDLEAMRVRLESGNLHMLTTLPPPDGSVFISLGLRVCEGCRKVGFLSIDSFRVTNDGDGRTVTTKTPVVENLRLNGSALDEARDLGRTRAATASVAGDDLGGVARW